MRLPSASTFSHVRPENRQPTLALQNRLPSLDFSHAPGSQYSWPAQKHPLSPANTIPTPPNADHDMFKSERDEPYHVNASLQNGDLPATAETMAAPGSFTARKPAASNLPHQLQLPENPVASKFGAPVKNMLPLQSPGRQSVANLLTPPENIPGESLSPISSGAASVANAAAGTFPPFQPSHSWPAPSGGTGFTPLGLGTGSGLTPQPWSAPSPRGLFQPSLSSSLNTSQQPRTSPTPADGLPPLPMSYGGHGRPLSSSPSTGLPMPLLSHHDLSHHQQQALMRTGLPPASASQISPSSLSLDNPFKLPSAPQIPISPSSFSAGHGSLSGHGTPYPHVFPSHSPLQVSSMSAPPNMARMSPMTNGFMMQPPLTSPPIPPYSGHRYPPLGVPHPSVMPLGGMHSSMHHMAAGLPGHQPLPFNSGQAALQQMYAGQPPPQTPNDRPFKCDVCPQNFNRNHDLKRHKRIHLAVKPFPCQWCDKSFSRKDALKRHILVKGCGSKAEGAKGAAQSGDPGSPGAKSDGSGSVGSMEPNTAMTDSSNDMMQT